MSQVNKTNLFLDPNTLKTQIFSHVTIYKQLSATLLTYSFDISFLLYFDIILPSFYYPFAVGFFCYPVSGLGFSWLKNIRNKVNKPILKKEVKKHIKMDKVELIISIAFKINYSYSLC